MKIIDINLLHEASFVEEKIIELKFDVNKKYMSIELDGGDLDNEDYLTKVKIVIEDWYHLNVVERDDDNNIKKLAEYPQKFLTSIIEFHYSSEELKLVGVGYQCWVDWIFIKPKVTIYGEIDPNQSPIL